ncbi:MAG: histidine phosphatase family protein [Myxococcota bacterium]
MRLIGLPLLAFVLLSLATACSGDASAGAPDSPPDQTTTYYVVRHAERNLGEDPPINEEGEVRAERLADALDQAGIDEIVATLFVRTQQTGEPLAERTDIPISVAPPEMATWPEFATEVAAWQLDREVAGTTYLMIGHSSGYNTTLLQALGAPVNDEVLAEAYQDIVILSREPDGTVKLSTLQYGGPSSLDELSGVTP